LCGGYNQLFAAPNKIKHNLVVIKKIQHELRWTMIWWEWGGGGCEQEQEQNSHINHFLTDSLAMLIQINNNNMEIGCA